MNPKLKIKDSVYVLRDQDGQYAFISTATRRIKKFKVDDLAEDVILSLREETTLNELQNNLSDRYNPKDVAACVGALANEGLVREFTIDFDDYGRHSKQLAYLDELTRNEKETLDLHYKIRNSKVGVFGVGGIGTWIVNGLNQIGVGEIRISDPDIIEESNLNRQLLFTPNDIGRYKVDVVKERIYGANVIPFKKTVDPSSDLEDIISGCDFLINCADQPSVAVTTEIIDGYAQKHKIAYCVAGGYNRHLGMIGPVIIPGVTKTFQDFLEYQKRMDPLKDMEMLKDIKQTGNLGPIAGAVANIQVMEVFKYLTGKGRLNLNRFAEIDFMDLGIEWREF